MILIQSQHEFLPHHTKINFAIKMIFIHFFFEVLYQGFRHKNKTTGIFPDPEHDQCLKRAQVMLIACA